MTSPPPEGIGTNSEESGSCGAGADSPSSLYSARQYRGSHDCSSNGISKGFARSAGRSCPPRAHSRAQKANPSATGTADQGCADFWVLAPGSVNVPSVELPTVSAM